MNIIQYIKGLAAKAVVWLHKNTILSTALEVESVDLDGTATPSVIRQANTFLSYSHKLVSIEAKAALIKAKEELALHEEYLAKHPNDCPLLSTYSFSHAGMMYHKECLLYKYLRERVEILEGKAMEVSYEFL